MSMETPPYNLMGWIGGNRYLRRRAQDYARRRGLLMTMAEAVSRRFLLKAADPIASQPVWKLCQDVLGYEYVAGKQESNDCVSWGMKQAGEHRQVIEIAMGQEEKYRPWYAPWIYAVSRNQIGGGMYSPGSLGVWAAEAVAKYGVLFEDDPDVPPYSGSVAERWGRMNNVRDPEYQKFFSVAADNPCVCVEVRSVEEAVQMIRDYRRPLTIASLRGFRMQPREYKGYHVFVPYGSWSHQMCWIEYNEELPALYRLNSWGKDAHGKPLRGETAGGAWNLLDDIEAEFRTMDIECYALVEFQGEPSEPDHRIMDKH